MQRHIRHLFKDNFFIIAICITITIAYLSLMKIPEVKVSFGNSDKVYHLLAYFTLTICWLLSFYKKPALKYFIVLSCIIYGIIIEILQHTLTIYRTGDYKDALANTLGIVLGFILFNQIFKKKEVNSY